MVKSFWQVDLRVTQDFQDRLAIGRAQMPADLERIEQNADRRSALG